MSSVVLITGGGGFIGRAVCRRLLELRRAVRVLDNFHHQVHGASGAMPDDLASSVEIVRADVRDAAAVESALAGVETVVHLAAETGTAQSMYEISRYFSVNVQGTATLLDALQNGASGRGVKSILVASSRAIYGEGAYECDSHGVQYPEPRSREQLADGNFEPACPVCRGTLRPIATDECTPLHAQSVYGLTKQVQEQAVLMYAKTNGLNGFALRYQNVYGPGQSLKNPYTGVLAVFSNLARQGFPIDVYEDGLESRDFVYIDDVAEATIRALDFRGKFIGAMNVGSGRAISIKTIAEQISRYFGGRSEVRVSGMFRAGDIRHNWAATARIQKVLQFEPAIHFTVGLERFLAWAETQSIEDVKAYENSVAELSERNLMGRRAT